MKLTNERDIDVASLTLSSEQLQVRSQGLHVSAIISYISTTIGRRDNDFTRDDLDNFAMVGRMFEAQLARAIFKPPRYERLGEMEKDGIIGSPDAFDTEGLAVVEMKATWKSADRDIREFREYFWQIAAYCAMTETPRAQLCVFYVCGNWKPPCPIPPKLWNITFTADELRQNWRMLLENGKELQ